MEGTIYYVLCPYARNANPTLEYEATLHLITVFKMQDVETRILLSKEGYLICKFVNDA